MQNVLLVAGGGALGSVLRFVFSGWIQRIYGHSFPWGTLAVNLVGCLAIGFFWGISERRNLPAHVSPFFMTGLLGGFTTFSTFGLDSVRLLQQTEFSLGMTNVVLSNFLGLGAVLIGYLAARYFVAHSGR